MKHIKVNALKFHKTVSGQSSERNALSMQSGLFFF